MAVTMTAVAQAIVRLDGDYLQNSGAEVPYSFKRFQLALRAEELMIDTRSIKTRWDVMVAKGVIIPVGSRAYDRAMLDVEELNYAFKFKLKTDIPQREQEQVRVTE